MRLQVTEGACRTFSFVALPIFCRYPTCSGRLSSLTTNPALHPLHARRPPGAASNAEAKASEGEVLTSMAKRLVRMRPKLDLSKVCFPRLGVREGSLRSIYIVHGGTFRLIDRPHFRAQQQFSTFLLDYRALLRKRRRACARSCNERATTLTACLLSMMRGGNNCAL